MPQQTFLSFHNSPFPSVHLRGCAPAVGNSRGCAEQIAHHVFFFPASRTHAVVSGCGPTPGFCFPGQAESPRLRRAQRARAVPAQSCLCRQAHHPRCSFLCGGCPQSGLPRLFLRRASHARAAAVSKTRTLSFSSPFLARTRFFPGVCPRRTSVFPSRQKARACGGHTCGEQRRAPCLFLRHSSHARDSFRACARAGLLFSQAGRNPDSCSLRPVGNPAKRKPRRIPSAQKRLKS